MGSSPLLPAGLKAALRPGIEGDWWVLGGLTPLCSSQTQASACPLPPSLAEHAAHGISPPGAQPEAAPASPSYGCMAKARGPGARPRSARRSIGRLTDG